MRDDSLCHYGILGMKWGVRRFQNPDGSYTAAGKERYGSGNGNGPKEKSEASSGKSSGSGSKEERFWTDDRKRIARNIAIGAAVVTAVGVVGWQAHKRGAFDRIVDSGKNAIDKSTLDTMGIDVFEPDRFELERIAADTISSNAGLPKQLAEGRFGELGFTKADPSISIEQTMKDIYDQVDGGRHMRMCKERVIAAALAKSQSGPQCVAIPNRRLEGNIKEELADLFVDGGNAVVSLTGNSQEQIRDRCTRQILRRYDEGTVGVVEIGLDPRFIRGNEKDTGHAFTFSVVDGAVRFIDIDENTGMQIDGAERFNLVDIAKEVSFGCLDGLVPRDSFTDVFDR